MRKATVLLGLVWCGAQVTGCELFKRESNEDEVTTGDVGAGDSGDTPAEVSGPTTVLPGPAGAPAADHIPDIAPPPADPSHLEPLGDGQAISRTEIGLVLQATTTVDDANALLAGVNATIIGTIPEAGILLIQVPTATLAELMTVVATLNADPRVESALAELTPAAHALPPANHRPGLWEWALSDDAATPPILAVDGNWGLEMIRAPQMWNLDTYVRRHRSADLVSAGVVDSGFDVLHEDLGALSATGPTSDHGTFVSGIIGASWDNRLGVEGLNPWLNFIEGRGPLDGYSRLLRNAYEILRASSEVKAINNSWGWSYKTYDRADDGVENGSFDPTVVRFGEINGDNDHADSFVVGTTTVVEFPPVDSDDDLVDDTWAEYVAFHGARWRRALDKIAGNLGRSDFILVGSAGNDGSGYQSVSNSPIGNAAAAGDFRFISVMALANDGRLAAFSTVGGTVAAPGQCVGSTETDDGSDIDNSAYGCTWTDASGLYGSSHGTSFAAPYVTGLATALWKLGPTLGFSEVYALIALEPHTVPTASPGVRRIDAFNAAMGIDVLVGNKTLQTALVDVDDGTRDGNQRTTRGPGGAVTGDDGVIHTADGRRGDGKIGMADFRAFRDALLQAGLESGTLDAASTVLDGAANHPKKDLNGDGCVGTEPAAGATATCGQAPGENVYPRFDFNGDGKVDLGSRVPFKEVPKTDLEVLMDVWPADPALTEGWPAASLSTLIPESFDPLGGSADVEFRSEAPLGGEMDEIRITIPQAGTPVTRTLTVAEPTLLWTVSADVLIPTRFEAEGSRPGSRSSSCVRWDRRTRRSQASRTGRTARSRSRRARRPNAAPAARPV